MRFDFVIASAYFAGWRIVRTLPEKLAYKIFQRIGFFTLNRNGKQIRRLRENLQRVCPDMTAEQMEQLMKSALSSYMRYWCDTFRSPDWSMERISSTVTVSREELLTGPMRDGTGVVIALPHAGNWDHAGSYFCAKGLSLVTVAERLKPEALFNKFLEYRQNIGMTVIPLDSRAMGKLLTHARSGSLIALVADRDLSASGVDVHFFGHPARMPAGPALLAIRTGIPLITAFVSYTQSGIHIDFNSVEIPRNGTEAEKISAVVQRCADLFAQGISGAPQDWHMLQRIWVDGDFKEHSVK